MSDVAARLGVPGGQGRPIGWWGIVFAVVTEAVLFALLLFTWFYLRSEAPRWPPEGISEPELFRSGIRSVLLFASSATMSFAERGIRKGRRGRLLVGLVVSFALAAVFMAGHVHEMVTLPQEYTWAENAYASARYTILNFHGAHLAVGMLMVLYAIASAVDGRYGARHHAGVTVVAIYWHFIDVVWAFVYGSLYLLPHVT